MWLYCALCMLALLTLCHDAYGDMGGDMSKAIQLCCNEGTSYAENHTIESCSVTQSMPNGVRQEFGSLCLIARSQCCKEYFQKKQNCETGINVATTSRHCGTLKAPAKVCCDECVMGLAVGAAQGQKLCNGRPHGTSTEDLLSDEAYARCCMKAAKNKSKNSESFNSVTLSKRSDSVASLCEDYAPNELCAHHCIPVPGSYKCECNPGFMLMADGKNCMQVMKNRCKPRNPCQHKCNDNGVEVMCSCRRGYELMPDGKSCKDIDECLLELPVCLPGTKCYNIQGSYKCIPIKKNSNVEKGSCPPGFKRNAVNHVCDDINECKLPTPPCSSYLCENTVGAYKCGGVTGDPINLGTTSQTLIEDRCPPGFKFGIKGECEDVDECAIHKDDCNVISQFCINTHGSFHCQNKISRHCPPGFKIDPATGKCEDINECEDVSDICREDQICINQLGQYDCKQKQGETTPKSKQDCPDGMRMKSDVCEDIDECAEGTHLCDQHQNCLNTNGSYECNCKLGYELDITTGACVDMNECATGQHDCIVGSQRCDNTIGSFLCIRIASCGTGYILHHSTSKCEDIDECAIGTHNCARAGPEYQCMNLPGSFRCVRRRTSSTSTTTTTLPPEYYDDYYDVEEGTVVDNQTIAETTSTKTQESSTIQTTIILPTTTTTTTISPIPSSEKPTTLSTTTEPITQTTQEVKQDDTINYIVKGDENSILNIPETSPEITYAETERNSDTTKVTEPEIKYEDKERESTTSEEPDITYNEPKLDEKTKKFDPTVPEYFPYNPETNPPPVPAISEPKNYEPKPTIPDVNEKTEISNTIGPMPAQTERTDLTYPPIPVKPSSRYPDSVYVNINKETDATITADRSKDTKEVPKDRTNINFKPSVCPPGLEIDEFGACFDIDECATNRHSCSGLTEICRNTMGGYLCDCAPGFRKNLSTGICDFISTSSTTSTTSTTSSSTSTTSSTTPPPTTSTSKSFFWGYPDYRPLTTRPFQTRNTCDAGYHLNSETGRCEDVNECTNGQANCAEVEICVNTDGGYKCECPPNWRLDEIRHRCVPIRNNGHFPPGYGNVPSYPPINTKEVINRGVKGTKFLTPKITQVHDRVSVFNCPWGYRLGNDNTCQDIDECSTEEAKCGPLQLCTNLRGGYTCSCPKGHKLVGDHDCQDVDECALAGKMTICSQNADCVNTIGSYQCRCHKGYRSAPINDKVCVNVDECAESRPGTLCQHRCNDVWGSYRCSCHRGYRLNPDNSTCSDVDECLEFKSKNPCVGRCLNEPGSYRCACPPGYRLAEDKRSCIDIDECSTGEATCAKSGVYGDTSHVCFNTRGSYKCHRITCPMGYRLEGKHRCNKVDRECRPGDWNCAHQATTVSYNFITFVSKLYIPADKVKLFTMRGPSWAQAKMKFQLRLVDINAPPSVRDRADTNTFFLQQYYNEAVVSLVRPLEGPQSIELELSMELYNANDFGGIAVARLFIYVSEYEF